MTEQAGMASLLPEEVLAGWGGSPDGWGAEQAYIYFERLGIGAELAMRPADAERVARREASLSVLPAGAAAPPLVLLVMERFNAAIVSCTTPPSEPPEGTGGPATPSGPPSPMAPPAAAAPPPEPAEAPPPAKPLRVSIQDHPSHLFPELDP